ncbi:hypothetical protein [Novosphingobium pentaromativorans]|uniref:Uncharacterized protein n=1 Tax=Novosphingobium pentaromativorans US6-1 TaxID=1088721 RepID=G6E8R3_9SPHN|nr:hypothetical protein [Novosphingobium pentaromativorans]AIT81254.1 hypothetical protein JI59_16445 [Novosphingobium pentaromativorans US6-1]EHJ62137.1 hypothetical protein NSU_0734 [Novosphingobium pentaromativorans US6-1]
MKLVIMACSGTKRADAAPLAALDRYDGPMWQTLRACLARHPEAARCLASKDLQIWVLSGLYGFIPVDVEVPDYEQRISAALIAKMALDPSYEFQMVPGLVDEAEAVLFAGGTLYRDAMWKASGSNLWNIMKIDETDGAGIGEHRAQLAAWFAKQFPAEQEARAA